MLWLPLLAMLAGPALQDAPPATPVATVADTPEMAQARANKPLMKAGPKFVSGPSAHEAFPEAARAAGAHGKVLISGIIGADGKFLQPIVAIGSRSALLDAAALAAAQASVFEPARDAAGNAIAVPATVPFEFSGARSPGKGGGVLRYTCGQFARDQDWWAANWPETEHDELYTMTLGVMVIQGGMNLETIQRATRDLKKHWPEAIEACRKKPDALLVDVLPEGKAMRALAERDR